MSDTNKPSRFPVVTIEADDNAAQVLQKFYDYGLTMTEACLGPGGDCLYRSLDKQNACLIGAALTDEEAARWEGDSGREVALRKDWPAFKVAGGDNAHRDIYTQIQSIHDVDYLFDDDRDDHFLKVANRYGVNFKDGKFTMHIETKETSA